ncbi:MAG: methionine--tRNA ligase [archaeon]
MVKKVSSNLKKKSIKSTIKLGEKRLVTAALPYINNIPHLGHIVGSHLPADIFARFCRARGYETLFVGGTDEHGSTTEIAASQCGVDVKTFGDVIHVEHKKIYDWFNISYDNFSRTTNPEHYKTTQEFFKKIYDNGFIREGTMKVFYSPKENRFLPDRYIMGTCPKCGYERANGDQCEKCTSVLEPLQLVNPKSLLSGDSIEIRDAKHLFLRLDKISKNLEKWIKTQKIWRSQVSALAMGWIKEGLKERCITRDLKHGVPVPLKGYEDKVFYVWFDAPIGYVSFAREKSKGDSFWTGKSKVYHFLGKDNIPFHTIFWPAILLARGGLNLPYNVIGLQYLNYEGGKFSKSQKRGVFCEKLPETGINVDLLRAYLTFVIPETGDTEYKWEDFQKRVNADIIGNYANLVNRTVNFISKRLGGEILKPKTSELSELDKQLYSLIEEKTKKITDLLENSRIREAFLEILLLSNAGNKYFDDTKPWDIVKTDVEKTKRILYVCANLCRSLAILSAPFLQTTAQKIWEQLNLKGKVDSPEIWDSASEICLESGHKVNEPQILFEKVTEESLANFKKIASDTHDVSELFKPKLNKPVETKKIEGIATMADMIKYDDFAKLDLRVGTIKNVEPLEGADKLWKLTVDLGTEIGQRTILAGIKKYYSKEQLTDRQIIVIVNLEYRKMKGSESQGMLLAAGTAASDTCILISPEKKVENGTKIG